MRGVLVFVLLFSSLTLTCDATMATPPDPLADARKLIGENKYDEAAPKLALYLKQNRFDGQAWSAYAVCLHGQKKYEESIAAGMRAIELGPAPSSEMYNIACVYALPSRAPSGSARTCGPVIGACRRAR